MILLKLSRFARSNTTYELQDTKEDETQRLEVNREDFSAQNIVFEDEVSERQRVECSHFEDNEVLETYDRTIQFCSMSEQRKNQNRNFHSRVHWRYEARNEDSKEFS